MDVFCSICGKRYDIRDPEVTHWFIGDEWSCADESACFERKAMAHLAEQEAAR